LLWLPVLFLVLALGPPVVPTSAEDPKRDPRVEALRTPPESDKRYPKDEAALLENAKGFVEVFHKGDARALAAFWTEDGDYVDQAGRSHKGRDAIEKTFQEYFAENKGLKLRIDIADLRFVTPDVAVEDGMTAVIPPDGGPPSRARYTIIHVKKDGKWLLSSVRDAPFSAPTQYDHLRGLEWAIGEWAEEAKGEAARASFAWAQNQNFIVSTFTTSFKNIAIGGGVQWIGWDPIGKQIRSWSFESSGGYGESTWAKKGDSWVLEMTAVLPNGKKVSATTVLSHPDADTLVWQSRNRSVDGKEIPDAREIRFKRVK
jgi:uncharacterized protein (TIGR02246 family)